ncbi:MAG: DUF2892 domain-containing protein [Gemmatimonadaceae bacterium]|nr:DUF2892 domain-containing protein [Gemmatimonadaceae bacterium]
MTHSRPILFLFAAAIVAMPAATHAQAAAALSGDVAIASTAGGPRLDAASVTAQRVESGALREVAAPRRDNGFASSGFAQFMSSPAGRILRVVAGAGMIGGGIAADSKAGTTVAVIGAVPLLAGTFDFCILSPLFGGPLKGRDIRAAASK